MTRLVAGFGVALLLLSAGCGAASGPGADVTADPFPPRPKSFDLRSTDPCSTITTAQAGELGIVATSRSDLVAELPGCLHITSGGSYRVQFLVFTGAHALLPGYPDRQGLDVFRDPVETVVDGFGAVEARLVRGRPADCAFTVDTGTDSSAQFYYSTTGNRSDSPADVAAGCDKAREFASMSLSTLSAG